MNTTRRTITRNHLQVTFVFHDPADRTRTRVYVDGFPHSTNPDERAARRESIETARVVAEEGLRIASGAAAVNYLTNKLRFNRRLGCSCGCSPGFDAGVVDGNPCDIHVTWGK